MVVVLIIILDHCNCGLLEFNLAICQEYGAFVMKLQGYLLLNMYWIPNMQCTMVTLLNLPDKALTSKRLYRYRTMHVLSIYTNMRAQTAWYQTKSISHIIGEIMYLYVTPLRFVIADTWLPWLHLMLYL